MMIQSDKWFLMLDEIKRQNANGIAMRGGKKYTSVAVRNEIARRFLGEEIGVSTEIVQWSAERGAAIVVKATIRRTSDGAILATGHAEEIRGAGNVNQTSALENAETSAIGRALAALGCNGGEFASANEMDGVERKREAISGRPAGYAAPGNDSANVRPAEPPHDPQTGEILDERNGPPEEAMPPSVATFIDQVKEHLAMNGCEKPTRDQLEHGYAMAVIENIAKRKSSAKAKQWFGIFCDLHAKAIGRIQDEGLKSQVRSAIALKQAMIDGENPDPADYGHPFGAQEPIVLGEIPVVA